MSIQWNGSSPPQTLPDPSIRVLRLKAGQKYLVRLLGPPTVVWVHWTGDRSLPCLGEPCDRCPPGPRRWKAFAAAEVTQFDLETGKPQWRPYVVEITHHAAADLEQAGTDAILLFSRPAGRANGPVSIAATKHANTGKRRACFSVLPYLDRLWGTYLSSQHSESPAEAADSIPFRRPDSDSPSVKQSGAG
jgi:hypothetical protein